MSSIPRADSEVGSPDGLGSEEPTFERFTDRARRVVVLAKEDALLLGDDYIGSEHLLLGLIHEGDGIAAKAIGQFGVSLESARGAVRKLVGPSGAFRDELPALTKDARKILSLARVESAEAGQTYVATWHILLALFREGDGVGARVLLELGADLPKMKEMVFRFLETDDAEEVASLGGGLARVEWIAAVVTKGLRPTDYEAAYSELSTLVTSYGLDIEQIDPLDVLVRSVNTEDGPGLEMRVRQVEPG